MYGNQVGLEIHSASVKFATNLVHPCFVNQLDSFCLNESVLLQKRAILLVYNQYLKQSTLKIPSIFGTRFFKSENKRCICYVNDHPLTNISVIQVNEHATNRSNIALK